MELREILMGGGGIMALVMTLVQISPVQVKPWSWLLKKLGSAINAEVLEKVEALQEKTERTH